MIYLFSLHIQHIDSIGKRMENLLFIVFHLDTSMP